MVHAEGFEPPTNGVENRGSIQLSYARLVFILQVLTMVVQPGFEQVLL